MEALEATVIARLMGGVLAVGLLGAVALVLGFHGYQAYLKWLVGGRNSG